jgi:hypothetical protein
MNETDEHPVTADPATLRALRDLMHDLDTEALTAHARSLGLAPPDERPGWLIVLEYGPGGVDRGLVWVDPDED